MVKRIYKRRKKSNIFLLVLLVLGISVGFAILSQTLNITGIVGINKNTWDIHWENVQPNASSTVTAEKPVISDNATKVSFEANLELPGDFYEFDVDAKNDGTVAGTITDIRSNVYKVVEEGEDNSLPDYIKYTVVYKGTTTKPTKGDILGPGDKQTYTVRIEYDSEADELPDEDITIKVEEEIDYGQQDLKGKNKITFDPNGGSVTPTVKYIDKNTSIGSLPTPVLEGKIFAGWYIGATDGIKINASTVPTSDITVVAHWNDVLPTFDIGKNVNTKIKALAGDTLQATNPHYTTDTNITAFIRSETEPSAENKTEAHIISAEDSLSPIYAWYDKGTIYYWSNSEKEYLNTDASYMFSNMKGLTSIEKKFDASLTTDMSGMFSGLSMSSLDFSDMDTSSAINMTGMFSSSSFGTLDLTNLNTSNVENMNSMFSGISMASLDLSSLDTSNVTNMSTMFASANLGSLNLSNLNTSKVTTMSTMFASASMPSADLSSFDTKNVTDMNTMFAGANIGSVNLSSFNTSNVTNMSTMFAGSQITSLDLSNFDVSKVNNFGGMFGSASKLTDLNISGWKFDSVTSIASMFAGLSSLETLTLKDVDTSNITNMQYLFSGSTKITSLDLSSFDVSKVTTFSLFGGNSALKSIDMSGWNFASVTSISGFFNYGLTGLETINLTNVDTSTITDMTNLFNGCSKIKKLNLSSFDTSKVTNMGTMFASMSSLKTIIVSNSFVTDKVTSDGGMFYNSPLIIGGKGTPWESSHIGVAYAHYDYGETNPGYFNAADAEYYTISLNPNGGTVVPSTIEVNKGDAIGKLPTPTRSGKAFSGWHATSQMTDLPITSDYIPESDMTLYANWNDIEAKFADGKTAGIKMKQLAGTEINSSYPYSTSDTNIKAFLRTPIEPGADHKTTNNIISAPDSKVPIYAWFDNGTIYWWTQAEDAYLNEDAQYMFAFMNAITNIDTSSFKTSITKNMYYMFGNCRSLLTIDVSSWDTSNVTNLSYTFYTGSAMKSIDLSSFNTSNVTNMNSMIGYMSSLENVNLSNFDFTNYNPGRLMDNLSASGLSGIKKLKIENAILPQDLSYFMRYNYSIEEISLKNSDSSNATNMEYMFSNNTELKKIDLTGIDTSNVTNMQYMFDYNSKLESIDVSHFNTSKVTNMFDMFYNCDSLVSLDLSNFDTRNVTNMKYIAGGCDNLNELNISNFRFDNFTTSHLVYDMVDGSDNLKILIADNIVFPANSYMAFYGLRNVEILSLKNADTSNVTNMQYMFENCEKVKMLDLTSFNTRNVTNMSYMFSWDYELKTIIVSDDFVVDQVTNSSNMFTSSSKIVGGKGTAWDSNHIDKEYAHYDGGESDPGYFNEKDVDVEFYTIKFNANGGKSAEKSRKVLKGQPIGLLPTAQKKDSSFEGWRIDIQVGTIVDSNYVPTSDMTLNATWIGEGKYTITLDPDGGSVNPLEVYVNIGDEVGTLPKPEKDNKVFTGWYLNDEKIQTDYVPTNNEIFKAKWHDAENYTITLDPNGGSVNPTSITVVEDRKIGELPTPTKANKIFTGWYDNETNKYVDENYVATKDITFVAKYRDPETYTVTLNANGGSVTPSSKQVIENEAIGELPIPTWSDHHFVGWFTKRVGGKQISSTDIINSNTEVYAHWKEIYTITFNPNGGVVSPTSMKVLEGDEVGEMPIPTRDGYRFIGWYTSMEYVEEIESTTILHSSMEVIAKWVDLTLVAKMDTGRNVNYRIKRFNNSNARVTTDDNSYYVDNSITSIQHADKLDKNVGLYDVSSEDSDLPVYMWHKNGVIYYYSDTQKVYMNEDSEQLFMALENLETIDLSIMDTSLVENMKKMFYLDEKLLSVDVSNFNTSNVTSMNHMFYDCRKLKTIAVENFDTGNVVDMSFMFNGYDMELESLDVSEWDTKNVENTSYMFGTSNTGNNYVPVSKLRVLDVSNWDVSKVKNMRGMFADCTALTELDVSKWNTSSVEGTGLEWTFHNCSALTSLNVNNFNIDKITSLKYTFAGCDRLLELDISNWSSENITNLTGTFKNLKDAKRLDISGFTDTSKVTSLSETFQGLNNLENVEEFQNIVKNFNTSNVTTMFYTFDGCLTLQDLDLSGWDTRKVTNMCFMFSGDARRHASANYYGEDGYIHNSDPEGYSTVEPMALRSITFGPNWSMSKVKNPNGMFESCRYLTSIDVANWDMSSAESLNSMFAGCRNLTDLDVSRWDVSNATSMFSLFQNCRSLTSIDVSNWNVSKVTSMDSMFSSCTSLTSLNIKNWNTSSLKNMSWMFHNTASIRKIDLNGWDTSELLDMSSAFSHEEAPMALEEVDLSSFNTSKVENMQSLFYGCENLKTIYASNNFVTSGLVNKLGIEGKNLFTGNVSLVGGNGTRYNSNYTDKTYARIDKSGSPGYFTLKSN